MPLFVLLLMQKTPNNIAAIVTSTQVSLAAAIRYKLAVASSSVVLKRRLLFAFVTAKRMLIGSSILRPAL